MAHQSASLSAALAPHIPEYIRARAAKYTRGDRTRNTEWSESVISYRVHGSETYTVDVLREPGIVVFACSCPYFEDRGPCKHLWAVATLVDQDPRWDGSWLEGDPAIEFETEAPAEGDDDSEPGADLIDAGSPGLWQVAPRGYWVPGPGQAGAGPRKPKKQADPVTAAAQAAVNRLAQLRQQLAASALAAGSGPKPPGPLPPPGAELIFVVDAAATRAVNMLSVHVATRARAPQDRAPKGPAEVVETPGGTVAVDRGWSAPKALKLSPADVVRVTDPSDRALVALLTSASQTPYYGAYPGYVTHAGFGGYGVPGLVHGNAGGPDAGAYAAQDASLFGQRYLPLYIPPSYHAAVLAALCASNRAFLFTPLKADAYHKLLWDPRPWSFRLAIVPDPAAPFPAYSLTGALVRGAETLQLDEPALIFGSGYVITTHRVSPVDASAAFWWVANLRMQGPMRIPREKADDLLADLLSQPVLPPLDVPEELRFEEPDITPVPVLTLRPDPNRHQTFAGTLAFDYDGEFVERRSALDAIYRPSPRSLIRRKRDAEEAAEEALRAHRVRVADIGQGRIYMAVPFKAAPAIVADLVPKGWRITVDNKPFRVPGETAIDVTSRIDWFDINGSVDFGGVAAPLPELLAAVRRGDSTVVLPDGSIGVLTAAWAEQYGALSAFSGAGKDGLRAGAAQLGLLDALLASREGVRWTDRAREVRDRLRAFDGIAPADAPASFEGTLRGYQRLGLGWLRFLQDLGMAGCLADDMGLGKTITVLAMLDARRAEKGDAPRASLVVAPRSLLFNWARESERFTPALCVAHYHGAGRDDVLTRLGELDIVLTTYGTLRRDAAALGAAEFDYAILDEAQAIKNAGTASAKATRLLRARHRLALSGTPIENQLGDLWSLFEFLNPGLLGSLHHGLLARARKGDGAALDVLRRGLRPFILRRTKAQVAPELPARSEETMLCELETGERRLYNQLRDHYRQAVLGLIERQGLQRSRFQILEALLRLRQAACHPGLIDAGKHPGSSSKLDALLERLDEARAEGHKALVFSQFTSLLAFVRRALDEREVPYEYLDGQTRDRERSVARFQQDPSCPLFLVSLKAGGLGLNLTAADYVFLLDPWWNPAVEAQAIDRAHRIGQERPVFAYRLIAADTVEEHIVELQARKRQLADAIISADDSGLASLTREDLELLLR